MELITELTPLERRTMLADIMIKQGFKVNKARLAKWFDVSPPTISADLKHKDYYNALNESGDDWHHRVNHESRDLLELLVDQGNMAARGLLEFVPIDGDKKALFNYDIALGKTIDRGQRAMEFKLSTGDPKFSAKYEHIIHEQTAPADDPELDHVINQSIDKQLEGAYALVNYTTQPKQSDNGGSGNGSD